MLENIEELIRQSKDKAIPYDQFIAFALYHPEYGYYRNPATNPFGKSGDFYTSSYIGEVFCEVLADSFIKISNSLDIPLEICELGGGDGRFARQLFHCFKKRKVKEITYYFVDKKLPNKHFLKEFLNKDWRLECFSSIEELRADKQKFSGIIFSNEFFDAQPIPVVVKRNNVIKEIYITLNDNLKLIEIERDCREEIVEWLQYYSISLEEGQRMEVPIYLHNILGEITQLLTRGVMYTIDYGYRNEEWKKAYLRQGSLRGYLKHEQMNNVLQHVGEMDITHHIHWDPFLEISKEYNFTDGLLLKQRDFLLNLNILDYLQSNIDGNYFSYEGRRNRAIQSLISDEQMGSMFDVCVQGKGVYIEQLEEALNIKRKTQLENGL